MKAIFTPPKFSEDQIMNVKLPWKSKAQLVSLRKSKPFGDQFLLNSFSFLHFFKYIFGEVSLLFQYQEMIQWYDLINYRL